MATHPSELLKVTPPKPVLPPRRLAERVAASILEVHRIAKDGRNENQGYNFVRESDVMEAVREVLARNGVIVVPAVADVGFRSVPTKSGQASVTDVRMVFSVRSTDTDEVWDCGWYGCGADTTDKGGNKAITSAEKYFLLKLLKIPTGTDPDGDSVEKVTVPPPGVPRSKDEKREATDAKLAQRQGEAQALAFEVADLTREKDPAAEMVKASAYKKPKSGEDVPGVKKGSELQTIQHADYTIENLRKRASLLAGEAEPPPF